MFHETIWFLGGDTNIKYLEDNKCPVWRGNAFECNLPAMQKEGIFPKEIVKYSLEWDSAMKEYGQRIRESEEFAERFGDAGPIYGQQWRRWKYFDEDKRELVEIDQLRKMIEVLKKKPTSKKNLVSAWNPGDTPKMSLEPCHVMYQATANEEGELELQLYQRSCDQFLGVPFNLASYSALTQVIAKAAGLIPKTFIHTFGDSHFYTGIGERTKWYKENFKELQYKIEIATIGENHDNRDEYLGVLNWIDKNCPKDENEEKYDHVTAILEQLSKEPGKLPRLVIAEKPFDKLTIDDFVVEDYNSHPAIRRAMAV